MIELLLKGIFMPPINVTAALPTRAIHSATLLATPVLATGMTGDAQMVGLAAASALVGAGLGVAGTLAFQSINRHKAGIRRWAGSLFPSDLARQQTRPAATPAQNLSVLQPVKDNSSIPSLKLHFNKPEFNRGGIAIGDHRFTLKQILDGLNSTHLNIRGSIDNMPMGSAGASHNVTDRNYWFNDIIRIAAISGVNFVETREGTWTVNVTEPPNNLGKAYNQSILIPVGSGKFAVLQEVLWFLNQGLTSCSLINHTEYNNSHVQRIIGGTPMHEVIDAANRFGIIFSQNDGGMWVANFAV
jgi:hypothetical protein